MDEPRTSGHELTLASDVQIRSISKREIDVRLKNLEGAGREQQGKLWFPLLIGGAVALGIGAALVRMLIR